VVETYRTPSSIGVGKDSWVSPRSVETSPLRRR
jgi:hypothetical protein